MSNIIDTTGVFTTRAMPTPLPPWAVDRKNVAN